MTLPEIGTLNSLPALDHPDLLAPPVVAALAAWPAAGEVAVVEIDPEQADTAAMSAAYDLPMDTGANCVVIAGSRAGEERVAACVVRADTRADVNNRVRRLLDVRKASFLSMDRAVAESGMEYGGITPLGLPTSGGSWSTRAASTSTSRSSARACGGRRSCFPAGCWASSPAPRSWMNSPSEGNRAP